MIVRPRAGVPRWLWPVIVVSLLFVNPYVRGDGNGYYAWLVSAVIDHDLDFENQYRHADPFFRGLMFDSQGRPNADMITPTGRLGDQWSVGPALLWTPWFLAAHAAVQISRAFGSGIPADGYSWPYRYVCAVGTAIYGWCALLLARRAAELVGRARGAWVAMLMVWATTPLPVYQYFLPFHVPALSAFAVACFVWRWLSLRPLDRPTAWIQWGVTAGLMTVVYQLNAVLLLVVAYEAVGYWRRRGAWPTARITLACAAGGLVVWVPQLIGKAIVYGTPLTTGYKDQFSFLSPKIWQTAVSANHGLFLWTPMALIAVVGFILVARMRHELWALAAGAGAFFFAVASYQNWHGQSSFGNRFFVSLIVIAVIGVAEIVRRASLAGPAIRLAVAAAAIVLALWNAGLAFQWGTGLIPNQGPVDFRQVASNQVTIVPSAAARFLRRYLSSRDATARQSNAEEAGHDSTIRLLVKLAFLYTCVEGLIVNITYPNVVPYLVKDIVLLMAYVALLTEQRPPTGSLRQLAAPLLAFSIVMIFFLVLPTPVSLVASLVGLKQRLFYIPLLYLAYYYTRTEEDAFDLVTLMAWAAIPTSLFGIYLYFAGPSALQQLGGNYSAVIFMEKTDPGLVAWRVPGSFTSPGQYSTYLLTNITLFTGVLFVAGISKFRKVLMVTALVLSFGALMVAGTRTPIIVYVLCVGFSLLLMGRLTKLGIAALVLYTVGATLFTYFGAGVQNRIGSIFTPENYDRMTGLGFGQASYEYFSNSPFGLGLGVATLAGRHFTDYAKVLLVESYIGVIAAETGIFGLSVWIWAMVRMTMTLLSSRKSLTLATWRPFWYFMMMLLLATIAMMPSASTIDAAPGNMYFWFMLGMTIRLADVERARAQSSDEPAEVADPYPAPLTFEFPRAAPM